MTKVSIIAALLFAAWAADHQFNDGYFTYGLLGMLRQIRHSFAW